MRLKHEHLSFHHCLVAEWQVHSHLVAVEVGVERRTCEWVELDCLTFDKLRLECLNTEAVQCWCTVEEHWVALHYVFENIPNHWFLAVHNLLGALHSLHNAALNELADNEWLVKLCRHVFWNTTFAHLQFRTYNDYRTCRIVDTLTEEVLTETPLLTLEAVAERLQWAVRLALHSTALARVVEQ